jgi:outer membrane protein
MAQQNAPQTVTARGTERASQAAVRAAYGAFLPNVTANVGAVRQFTGAGSLTRTNSSGEKITIQGNSWTYSNALSFNAQLFNAANLPNVRATRADVAAAEQNVAQQGYNVALSVEQQFFTALAARESEDAARQQLAQAQGQLDFARRRVVAGAATASDSLTAVVQVANAQLALLQAQTARRDANVALTRITGSTTPLSAATNDPAITALDTVRLDSAAIVTRADFTPAVQQAQAAVAGAHARQSVARASYFPTLNAGYSRSGSGTDSRFGFGGDPFAYGGQLNFSLSFPLFNQFSRENQIAVANVNATNAEATLRDARLGARQQAIQYLDAFRLGQQQVAMQQASVNAAQENLRVVQQRYQLGLSTIVDLLTAQTTLIQAQSNLISARNAMRLATAQLSALLGQPLQSLAATAGVTR